MNALEALADPGVFGAAFQPATSWAAWRAFLAALFALPMTEAQLAIYRRCTGRQRPPTAPVREAWVACGRRSGKSRVAALLAVWAATSSAYKLAPGERGVVMLVAADRRQARQIKNYVLGLLRATSKLEALIEATTKEAVRLRNGVDIEIHSCSHRTTRGYSAIAVIADELAFWRTDEFAADTDREVLTALRPGLATTGGLLLAVSSPYARRGELWAAYQRHHGHEDDRVLFWMADSATMNPSLGLDVVTDAFERDDAAAWSEFGRDGEIKFRSDVETFVPIEVVLAATETGCRERAPRSDRRYAGFVDPASGSGRDSFALAIGHREADTAVLDVLREVRPPFSPAEAIKLLVADLRRYGVTKVIGDAYAGDLVAEPFRKLGVTYEVASRNRSELFLGLLPALNSGTARLLDDPRLRSQLVSLERRTSARGKDTVTHPPTAAAHDDVANAAAGCLVSLIAGRDPSDSGITIGSYSGRAVDCRVCGGRGTLGSGSAEAPRVACFACRPSGLSVA